MMNCPRGLERLELFEHLGTAVPEVCMHGLAIGQLVNCYARNDCQVLNDLFRATSGRVL